MDLSSIKVLVPTFPFGRNPHFEELETKFNVAYSPDYADRRRKVLRLAR
jgi:hypothetical protein